MKFIHISDLHLGKRLNEFSMLEEQEAVLEQILSIVDAEAPNGVLVAGDVYDKSVPSAEAVTLFDGFLAALAARRVQTFVISGNHDSPERLAFGSRIMDAGGIHLSPVYNGRVTPVTLRDEYGPVNVYLLPFVKPAHVRRFFEDEEILSYHDAIRVAVQAMAINPDERNLLLTHQFVTGSTLSGSEEVTVGGTDNVDASVFDGFDYVALGHIHGAQNCGSERIRYCGTPLKYSFSEMNHQKSVTVVELFGKGKDVSIRTVDLRPIHDLREIRGAFCELSDPTRADLQAVRQDYIRAILTDEDDVPDAMGRLRQVYPNLMCLQYDNKRTREQASIDGAVDAETKTPFQLFAEFFELQNNAPMSDEQSAFVKNLMEKMGEDTV